MNKPVSNKQAEAIASALLDWYASHARTLPWRAPPGRQPDPYHVWLSEIMLQQTTVATVRRRFDDFIRRWPNVRALAAAPLEEVMAAWAGLGYYARARNLHKCAQVVAGELGGRFPDTPQALQELPGIGPYTAGAIAAIAFGHPAVAMDTNAERVIARLFAVEEPLPDAKPRLRALAEALLRPHVPGDFAQALMDLGAMICTARKPACGSCPLRASCAAHAGRLAEVLPRRARKAARPTRVGDAFFITRVDSHVLLRRRPARGMLGGMVEFPSSGWDGQPAPFDDDTPFGLAFEQLASEVRHTFTHFHLCLKLHHLAEPLGERQAAALALPRGWFWHPVGDMDTVGLPTLMRKASTFLREHAP